MRRWPLAILGAACLLAALFVAPPAKADPPAGVGSVTIEATGRWDPWDRYGGLESIRATLTLGPLGYYEAAQFDCVYGGGAEVRPWIVSDFSVLECQRTLSVGLPSTVENITLTSVRLQVPPEMGYWSDPAVPEVPHRAKQFGFSGVLGDRELRCAGPSAEDGDYQPETSYRWHWLATGPCTLLPIDAEAGPFTGYIGTDEFGVAEQVVSLDMHTDRGRYACGMRVTGTEFSCGGGYIYGLDRWVASDASFSWGPVDSCSLAGVCTPHTRSFQITGTRNGKPLLCTGVFVPNNAPYPLFSATGSCAVAGASIAV